jgi:hypothetical protein
MKSHIRIKHLILLEEDFMNHQLELFHKHKFIFPTPDGATSIGVCVCGLTQEGINSFDESLKNNRSLNFIDGKVKRSPLNNVDGILEGDKWGRNFRRGLVFEICEEMIEI